MQKFQCLANSVKNGSKRVKTGSKMLLRHHSIYVKSPGAISLILMFPALLICNAL